MKKVLNFLVVMMLMLAGCGGSGDETTVVTGYAGDEFLPAMIEEYNAMDVSDVKFVWEPITDDYNTVVKTRLAGGDAADIMYIDPFLLYELGDNGRLLDLSENIDSSSYSGMSKGLIEGYQIDGTQYALPYDYNTISLYYNKDLFDEAGLAYPTNEWTFEDWNAANEKLSKALPEGVAPTTVKNANDRFRTVVLSSGTDFYVDGKLNLTDPAVISALKFWFDQYDKQYFETGLDLGAGWEGEAFYTGKAAMTLEGSWMIGGIIESNPTMNWDVVEIPMAPGQTEHNSIAYSMGLGINAQTEYPQEAADFLSWYMSEEIQTKRVEFTFAKGGANLSPYVNANDIILENESRYQLPMDTANYAVNQMMGPDTAVIENNLNAMAETRFLNSGADVQQALTDTQTKIEDEIGR